MTFFTGDPSDRFMLWTRRALLLVWAVLLVTQLPSFAQQAQHVLSSVAPGPDRNAAIRGLAGVNPGAEAPAGRPTEKCEPERRWG